MAIENKESTNPERVVDEQAMMTPMMREDQVFDETLGSLNIPPSALQKNEKMETKSKPKLTKKQRMIRDLIRAGNVEWREIRLQ